MRSLVTLLVFFFSPVVFASPLKIHLTDGSTVETNMVSLLEEFPTTTFKTQLPWFPDQRSFTGIPVTKLLEQYGDGDTFAVTFLALNDYAATSTVEDIRNFSPIIAVKMNGKPIQVRHKGPYWLIFNLNKYPDIDNINYHSQMVWQIDEIILHSKNNDEKK
ncbi:hypothetical protein H2O73_15570 [Vibrio sp. 404]|uniref:Oxidoreductase molybdopterin-binding domain-containing protein n=1 Tax=Vibrio marinisediminis TaxID=2758441 RepID=A0A7W2FT56_9VIBR|nr:hypothetical protein [Vibrio marinisediminis]MBA5763783.1 hypothetical protein [Vibrio marinisediminis]